MAQPYSRFQLNILGLQKSWTYTLPIRPEPIIIGRDPESDLVLDHPRVSRRHAALLCTATKCTLVDLNSRNTTRLNGQKITPEVPVVLKPGDSLQIGAFNLDFEQIPFETSLEAEKTRGHDISSSPRKPVDKPRSPDSPPPPPSPPSTPSTARPIPSQSLPSLTFDGKRLLSYLPSIYHTDFMAEFLATFESILMPIEWQIDSFDLFLSPNTAPADFLPWLANWFELIFDSTWSEAQRRAFLTEAYWIYSRCGTRSALIRVLEIYTGHTPEVDDQSKDLPPLTFRVKLPRATSLDRNHIERIIDAYKPAHTAYLLEIKK